MQLFVFGPDGSRQDVLNSVEQSGSWLASDWVRPGMAFEIGSQRSDEALGRCVIP